VVDALRDPLRASLLNRLKIDIVFDFFLTQEAACFRRDFFFFSCSVWQIKA
jgi:hypothetical protein